MHFPSDCRGKVKQNEDEECEVFRKVIVDPRMDHSVTPGASFTVRFKFKRFSDKTNRLLSLIPIPFIVAQPGFRSKTWMIGRQSGTFYGVYEWDRVENANSYWTSFPMELMKRRAARETLQYEIRALESWEGQ